jgi:hypothetical protein
MLKNIQKAYDDIAINAFKNYTICRENDSGQMEVFRLAEIEIYIIDKKNNIDDIFIHKNKKQKEFQKEYPHYSGFDICLGNGKDIYCGMLVRGLMNDDKVIYGPGRVKYNRENRKKIPRKIEILFDDLDEQKICFSDDVDSLIDMKNIIFKLPRVNLANTTSSKYLDSKDNLNSLNTYLNLNARYIRVKDDKFYKSEEFSPEEPREIFNALITYKQKIINE